MIKGGFQMNFVTYFILWVFVGLFAGVVANWISTRSSAHCAWQRFGVDLLIGAIGAVMAAYAVLYTLFGMDTVLSSFSIIMAVAGAAVFLFISWLLRKVFNRNG
jgi:uncharacterized membrane protein YeaQ/YmgE (transglycosylase-associated protein family)